MLLVGCAALPKPFDHKYHKAENSLVALADGGAVRVEIDSNLPEFIAASLSEKAIIALARANIPASADAKFTSKYVLKAYVKIKQPNAFGPEQATFVWILMTKGVGEIGVFEQSIQGDQSGWLVSDPGLFAIIAEDAGRQIAALLHADQNSNAMAGHSSNFLGKKSNPKNMVSTVYFSEVYGAPGDGNLAILKSLKFLLDREVGYVASTKDEARYVVQGVVNVSQPFEGKCDVAITWLVTSSDGKALGKVTQKNKVTAGSLDRRWGQLAFTVADGAMLGIKDVIGRDLRRQR